MRAKYGQDDRDSTTSSHRLKTHLSSLLQEKSREARWAAVVLIKATLESSGQNGLQSVGPWARGILGLLAKPEPVATKRLAILTLTRIFILTQGQQSLVREVTTPLLPGFVTACLNNANVQGSSQTPPRVDATGPLLRTILQAMIKLLPNHRASFRPFIGKLRALLAPLLAPTPSHVPHSVHGQIANDSPPASTTALAQRLLVLLPFCAPQNTSGDEWSRSLQTVLASTSETADHVFRAVREQGVGKVFGLSRTMSYEGTVDHLVDDDLCLPGWRSIYAGSERLIGLLQLVQAHVASATASEIAIPLGAVFTILNRILSAFEPVKSRGLETEMINPEVSRDEREGLWCCLPAIHGAAVDTLWTVTERVGITSMSFAPDVLEQLLWVFDREQENLQLRASIYRVIEQVLKLVGPSMSRSQVSALSSVFRRVCEDVLPYHTSAPQSAAQVNGSKGANADNADSYLKPTGKAEAEGHRAPKSMLEAKNLMVTAMSTLPAESIPKAIRRELDRTSILCRDHKSLLASVLNPPMGTSETPAPSLLPFLARTSPALMNTEALLRPRLPFFRASREGIVNVDEEVEHTDQAQANGDAAFAASLGPFSELPWNNKQPWGIEKSQDKGDSQRRQEITALSNENDVAATTKRKRDDQPLIPQLDMHQTGKRQRIAPLETDGGEIIDSKPAESSASLSVALDKEPQTKDVRVNSASNVDKAAAITQFPVHLTDETLNADMGDDLMHSNLGSDLASKEETGAELTPTLAVASTAPKAKERDLSRQHEVGETDCSSSEIPSINLESSSDEYSEDEEDTSMNTEF